MLLIPRNENQSHVASNMKFPHICNNCLSFFFTVHHSFCNIHYCSQWCVPKYGNNLKSHFQRLQIDFEACARIDAVVRKKGANWYSIFKQLKSKKYQPQTFFHYSPMCMFLAFSFPFQCCFHVFALFKIICFYKIVFYIYFFFFFF